MKDKWKDSVEKRLARLEASHKIYGGEPNPVYGIEPSKPVTEECVCHHPEVDGCVCKSDKPSEFIQIPRKFAEKYIRYVEAKDAPEAIEYYRSRQNIIDAIKQALEGDR